MKSRPASLVVALSLAYLLVAFDPASAQTVVDQRVWTTLSVQGRFGPESPWRWSADTLVRFRDVASTLDTGGERVVITRDLTSRSSVGAGYSIAGPFPEGRGGDTAPEHRLIQQYAWASRGDRRTLSFRTRVEQRFVDGNSGTMIRVREQVRTSQPISDDGRVQVVIWEEVFFYVNSTDRAARGFDANRAFAGVRWSLWPRLGLEVGYMNLFSNGQHGARDRMSHVLSTGLALAL